MSNANSRVLRHSSAGGAIVAALSLIALILFDRGAFAKRQSGSPTRLLVTPSATVLLVGENSVLSVVDETGHPVSSARWSIHPYLAGLHEENGEVRIEAKQPGRAVLTATATANSQTATAFITIVSGTDLPPATVRWSLQPMAGFETLRVLQAVPSADGPVFIPSSGAKRQTPSSAPLARRASSFGLPSLHPQPVRSLSSTRFLLGAKFFKIGSA